MTKDEFLKLKTAPEMWTALVQNPELRTKELRDAFEQRKQEEFEAKIIKRYGRFDPDMHYDMNKK